MFFKEKGKGGSYIPTVGVGLTIDSFTHGKAGFIKKWTLAIAPDTIYEGTTQAEFIETLHKLWPDATWRSEWSKDKIVIYTENVEKARGFFYKNVTEEFGKVRKNLRGEEVITNLFYIDIDVFFEIRSISRWGKKDCSALEIANYAQHLIDTLFVPEKSFYLTPQQRGRKVLAKAGKNDPIAGLSYPVNYDEYKMLRRGYFAGLLYMPYTGRVIEEPMMVLDITSSYIFDMLCEPHVVSSRKRVDPSTWELYIGAVNHASFGCYKIKYSCIKKFISSYTDINGKKLEQGEHEVYMVLTSTDLETLMDVLQIDSLDCTWLYEYDMADLPKYFIDEIVKSYLLKATATKEEKPFRKSILNAWYGDTFRKYDKEEEFWPTRLDPSVSPLWGIFITAYAKKWLFKLASKVKGWYYSDTDSIICLDTPENRALLADFNKTVQAKVKIFCDKYGYDYEQLKALGTFKVEAEIKRLKVWTTKTYAYEKTNGEVVLKAAGLHQKENADSSIFNKSELDYKGKVYPMSTKEHAECDIDGVHYESFGSYYERTPKSKLEDRMLMAQLSKTMR